MTQEDRFDIISFDCYGTLIDWEAGLLSTTKVLLAAHGEFPASDSILADYAEFEAAAEAGPYVSYREVLRRVVREFGGRYGFSPDPLEMESLVESLPHWRPFPDTVDALRRLANRYRLAVVSNVDEDLFAPTAAHLRTRFDHVVTADRVRAYKPSEANFKELLRVAGVDAGQVMHVAQSLYHDVAPARSLGIRTVRVNRTSLRPGLGATPAAAATPDMEVPDLATLADRLQV